MNLQLTDWIDNLQSEQQRIGENIRLFAEDKISKYGFQSRINI